MLSGTLVARSPLYAKVNVQCTPRFYFARLTLPPPLPLPPPLSLWLLTTRAIELHCEPPAMNCVPCLHLCPCIHLCPCLHDLCPCPLPALQETCLNGPWLQCRHQLKGYYSCSQQSRTTHGNIYFCMCAHNCVACAGKHVSMRCDSFTIRCACLWAGSLSTVWHGIYQLATRSAIEPSCCPKRPRGATTHLALRSSHQ